MGRRQRERFLIILLTILTIATVGLSFSKVLLSARVLRLENAATSQASKTKVLYKTMWTMLDALRKLVDMESAQKEKGQYGIDYRLKY